MTRSGAMILGLALAACDAPMTAPVIAGRQPDDARRAVPRPLSVRFVGVLVPAERADVAPLAPGIVAAVRVRAGDVVTEGQVVADLDPAPLRVELRAATASLAAARAATRTATVDLEDARRRCALETRSVQAGVSPAQNLEEARLAARRAEAALERARSVQAVEAARAQTARDQLAALQLRAPFAGTVTARFRDAGNLIAAGTSIVRIEGRGGMRLRFAVPPQDAARVAPPTHVRVTVDTIAVPFDAEIEQVSPTLDAASGMIFVEAALVSTPSFPELRSGLSAWVTLSASH